MNFPAELFQKRYVNFETYLMTFISFTFPGSSSDQNRRGTNIVFISGIMMPGVLLHLYRPDLSVQRQRAHTKAAILEVVVHIR